MRQRFPFPSEVGNIDPDWKRYQKSLFDDLYPQIQAFNPTLTNVYNPDVYTVTSQSIRMGRLWNINITVGGVSTAVNGYLDLPFGSFSTCLFLVKVDTDAQPLTAYIEKNTSRLYLPDWSASSRVIISGSAGE